MVVPLGTVINAFIKIIEILLLPSGFIVRWGFRVTIYKPKRISYTIVYPLVHWSLNFQPLLLSKSTLSLLFKLSDHKAELSNMCSLLGVLGKKHFQLNVIVLWAFIACMYTYQMYVRYLKRSKESYGWQRATVWMLGTHPDSSVKSNPPLL